MDGVADFDWQRVYVFDAYSSTDDVREALGFDRNGAMVSATVSPDASSTSTDQASARSFGNGSWPLMRS